MSAVLLAVFNDYTTADRVRMNLFHDGFPSDRIELTACCEPGRAALQPADSVHERFVQYYRALFTRDDERQFPELFAWRVESGAATVTVHPRGPVETTRATQILERAGPAEVAQHDLEHQAFEHAAARAAQPWVRHLWPESTSKDLCIYCRLFERSST